VQRAFVRSGRLHFACEHTQLVTQEAFTHVRRCLSDGRLDCHVVLIRYPALSTLPHWCGVAGWAAGRDRSGGDGQGLPTVEGATQNHQSRFPIGEMWRLHGRGCRNLIVCNLLDLEILINSGRLIESKRVT
jgi:hypothetical protein